MCADRRLAGRHALITGASAGIGLATARLFSQEGATVGLVARRGPELRRIAGELERAVAVPADVADHQAVRRAIDDTEAAFGPIDLVVNSAGVIGPTAIERLTAEVWSKVIATNLSGSFYVGREAGLRMRRGTGGHIINIASDLAFTAARGYVDYCASKAGVLGLTRGLAAEFAPTVLVNAVAPGPVDTPMLRHEFAITGDPEGARDAMTRRVPLRRIATADEIARAILFIVTDAAYATGAVLRLDGGTTMLNLLSGDDPQ
jgi:NAD(P)-dependent dehydrogenase (short-subunit alcohol dehydrogenase family)